MLEIIGIAALGYAGFLAWKHWPAIAAEFKLLSETGMNSLDED